jgi:hypothetical protein
MAFLSQLTPKKSESWIYLSLFLLVTKEPERVSVQLRGHDFTGLGFNVTGNMRDGIFIKDISNRGPAFESGKIAQGMSPNTQIC